MVKTTIPCETETKAILKKLGRKDETWDVFLKRLAEDENVIQGFKIVGMNIDILALEFQQMIKKLNSLKIDENETLEQVVDRLVKESEKC